MNVVSVVRKYIIKDLTGVIENYYVQENSWKKGRFGYWEYCEKGITWILVLHGSIYGEHMEIVKHAESKGKIIYWVLRKGLEEGYMELEIVKHVESKGVRYTIKEYSIAKPN